MIAGVRDARRLSPEAQEDLRRRVVAAVHGGMSQVEAARVFAVAPQSVSRWVQAWRKRGSKGLTGRRRGRKSGEQKALSARRQRKLRYAVAEHTPATFGLTGLVWTRKTVAELIRVRHGIVLNLRTVGNYLRSWGLSPQKPIRKAYEQDPESVRRWLEEDYLAIAARARREGALILWLDQTGIRSDATVARTWAPAGQTPVVGKTGKRFSVNAMCAIGNKGELYFTVYTGSFNGKVFLSFLDRLTRHLDRKVHLIVDGHPVHRRKTIQQWITKHAEAIAMHFLPGYSPELNPDELLNADLKRTVSTSTAPKTRAELKQAVRSFLHRLQKLPDRVRSYFGKPEVRYAA
ncbi:IS630 family transposase [Saccharopolyspora pogona]|uniref:IS630 family transposase n=1 Tax=Saccharopolyspora pogona TaxID=333966 RepID=UPI0016890D0C|nr:IS630 family transposase [Saccharopolyspora pogona]